jgi:hypothetical protein
MKFKLFLSAALLFLTTIVYSQINSGVSYDPIVVSGKITDVNHPVATLKTDDGTIYTIRMGPYWFWSEKNYKLATDAAVVKGETKVINGVNMLYPSEITQNGNTIKLADEKGIPYWRNGSGNGNGNGRGYCRGNGNGNGRGNGRGYGNCGQCPYGNR